MFVARCCGDTLRRLERVTARSGVSNEDNLRVPQQRIPTDRMALKDSSDNEAVRSRGQDLVSTQQCERKIKLQNKKERPKKKCVLRPFLTQSDYASRKRPFSTGLFFYCILLVFLLIVSRVDFIVFEPKKVTPKLKTGTCENIFPGIMKFHIEYRKRQEVTAALTAP